MNIFKTIIKAAKAVVRTVKELFGLTKAAYEAKVAKAKAWHEFKKLTNSDYIDGIISVITGIVRIFVPVQVAVTIIRVLIEGWGEGI
jgi:Fe2+ transport system protein B